MTLFRPFQGIGDRVQQFALPIVVKVDDVLQALGTGFVLHPSGLLVTAAHVLQEAHDHGQRRVGSDGKWYHHYELYAIYVSNEPHPDNKDHFVGGLLPIDHVWVPNELDIGFGWLRLPRRADNDELLKLYSCRISPALPKVGDRIVGIGYYAMKGEIHADEASVIAYSQNTALSEGIIEEIHAEYRDRGLMSFPCFRTNARFDHGMSGGPIFNESGNVIGVVSSSPSRPGDESHISYGSLIYPVLGCLIEVRQDERSPVKPTLLYDMAVKGQIQTDGTLNQLKVDTDDSGNRRVSIYVPNS